MLRETALQGLGARIVALQPPRVHVHQSRPEDPEETGSRGHVRLQPYLHRGGRYRSHVLDSSSGGNRAVPESDRTLKIGLIDRGVDATHQYSEAPQFICMVAATSPRRIRMEPRWHR